MNCLAQPTNRTWRCNQPGATNMSESRDVKHDRTTGQRQRVAESIKIRKQKRMAGLKKRRNNSDRTGLTDLTDSGPLSLTDSTDVDLQRYVQMVNHSDDAVQLRGVRSLRKILSNVCDTNSVPAQRVVATNIVPRLVQLLKHTNKPGLQFEVIWALTNIASTEMTDCVAVDQLPTKCNALPTIVQLMRSSNPDVREQSCWCIGNVVGDGVKLRDMVWAVPNSLTNLLLNITKASSEQALENAVWALSNMFRGTPKPVLSLVLPALPVLAKLVLLEHPHVVADTCWALSYLSDGDDTDIQALLDIVPAKRLVDLAGHSDSRVVSASLRCVGNIVSGSDAQTQAMIDTGGLFARLFRLLDHPKNHIQKEACWTLSNIAAGTTNQARQLAQYVEAESLVSKVINLALKADFVVKREACWVLANLCTRHDEVCITKVVDNQPSGLDVLCQALTMSDEAAVLAALEALEAILQQPSDKSIEQLIEQYGGLEHLEMLQESANQAVYLKAAHIVETYLSDNPEDSDDDAPNFTPF